MTLSLVLAFLFFIGSVFGWCLELLYRHIMSPNKKWINPGFCTGPYLPIYGLGLCTAFLIAIFEEHFFTTNTWLNHLMIFLAMSVAMTLIELLGGILCEDVFHVSLWDYSKEWGNFRGFICPKFSFYWALIGGIYYFGIHPHILNALAWLSRNLAFSFVIGYFFGVFTLDLVYSGQVIAKVRRFAKENDIVVRVEEVKEKLQFIREQNRLRRRIFFQYAGFANFREQLESIKKDVAKYKISDII